MSPGTGWVSQDMLSSPRQDLMGWVQGGPQGHAETQHLGLPGAGP